MSYWVSSPGHLETNDLGVRQEAFQNKLIYKEKDNGNEILWGLSWLLLSAGDHHIVCFIFGTPMHWLVSYTHLTLICQSGMRREESGIGLMFLGNSVSQDHLSSVLYSRCFVRHFCVSLKQVLCQGKHSFWNQVHFFLGGVLEYMIGLNDYRNVMIVFGTVFEMSYHMVFFWIIKAYKW